ncbi:carnitine O-acetyltransferase YAT1 [Ascoidea rubescens DSM 1968]|uniref:Acyltransferase ChoActase/COT/CPT n=1 Tax=Ascoidea rubescens DSM 1968 TaxID=1344418 RepID=A0A1D2VQA1_9ASCO|nr:acyltransferase ChoActase/COT/CPT [Ascoidea rubescens DSM 1968]ODV63791.1 acyltransferase ChoActase/COT/CPT [Ascoidea rubescens DSM 1968]
MTTETTFQYQDSIKKLPIPDLKDTCARYLEVLEPLQTKEEHEITKKAVNDFYTSPLSKYLDDQLRDYSKDKPSYIEQFWYDSYLNYDSPVVLNLNPFFLLEDDPTPINNSNQVKRAASLTTSSLKFIKAIRKENLPIDKLRNNRALCMYQYSKLFGTARIPTPDGCVMQTDNFSNHIIVLSRSQFYWFDVLDNDNNLLLSEADIMLNFKAIVEDSSHTSITDVAKSSFGVLTTENRRIWAHIRNKLSNDYDDHGNFDDTNHNILKIIDSALFIVCLDDIELESLPEISKNMLCGLSKLENGVQVGTCTNRWYDKIQIIVTKNAKAGINFEHTGVDGHTVLRFVSDIYTDSILGFAKAINKNAPSLWPDNENTQSSILKRKNNVELISNYTVTPRKLDWQIDSELSSALRFAETRLSDLIQQNEFKVLEFKHYGANKIKKMGMSPDAFLQMSFQATYYALYGKVECTYEPAMTKGFLHGRTEAIRTVSNESNHFVKKFFEANTTALEKINYLKAACSKHSTRTRECSMGLGQDRHLYALYCIWKRYVVDDNVEKTITPPKEAASKDLPTIFADAGWDKLNDSIISTSNCGNPSLRLFGFGPTSLNGFGLAYIIKDDSITVCCCSKHRQTQRFLDTLNSYYIEIERIWNEFKEEESILSNLNNMKFDKINLQESVSMGEVVTSNKELEMAKNYLLGGYGYFDSTGNDDKIKSVTHDVNNIENLDLSTKKQIAGVEQRKFVRLAEY